MTSRCFLSMLVACVLCGVTTSSGNAQIVPDTSLPVNSVVTPNGNTWVIEGGTTAGSTLFHSFREFSLPSQQEAFFNNDSTLINIITRVTGGQGSRIDGLIRANGTTNLLLINPSGIVLGNNARLNLGGSFLASTASGVQLADGSVFSATEANAPALLTINVPIGLQLGQSPGAIRVEGVGNSGGFPSNTSGLAVAPGRTLALVGGNVTLTGGILTAESGRIEVGSVANGTVSLSSLSQGEPAGGWRLGYEQVPEFREIQLINGSLLNNANLSSNPQAGIQIQGARIVLNQSQITSANQGSQPGANISVNASQLLEIGGGNGAIANQVASGASGQGGGIRVSTPQLSLQDGGRIQTLSFGSGAAGNVTVNADSIFIRGFAPLSGNPFEDSNSRISSENFGVGVGGNVSVSTRQLTLLDGGRVKTFVALSATGNGGSVTVNATDAIAVASINPTNPLFNSAITSESLGAGAGGDISVTTQKLTLSNGATIQSVAQGSGHGGTITVRASDAIAGSGVNPLFPTLTSGIQTQTFGPANGGNLTISTGRLSIQAGAIVSSSVLIRHNGVPVPGAGTGNAGDVTVNADQIEVVGDNPLMPLNASPSALGTVTFGAGNAGNVTISTRQLSVKDGGGVTSAVFPATNFLGQSLPIGTGNGGNLTVSASESISVVGTSSVRSIPSILGTSTITSGNAGNTQIDTRQLIVRDGGQVNSSTRASGAAGTMTIHASESILVSGTAANGTSSEVSANALMASDAFRQGLSAPAVPTGDTGELTISTNRLTVRDRGRIGVLHEGTGNAGRLRIDASEVFLDREGSISAATALGQGGDVVLNASDLLRLRHGSQITVAAGGTGDGGNLAINTDIVALLDGSKITANAFRGNGGNIQINAQGLLVSPDSTITASSQLGIDGIVDIKTPDVELSSGLVELPSDVVDSSNQIIAGCPADQGNVFVIAGQGGLPPNPTQLLQEQAIWQDLRFLDNRPSVLVSEERLPESQRVIVRSQIPQSPALEATTWMINPSGQVELVAQIPNASGGSWLRLPNCKRQAPQLLQEVGKLNNQ